MRDDDLIERYLEQLDAELRLPARARRRIIAEARDHLGELPGPSPYADTDSPVASKGELASTTDVSIWRSGMAQ